MSKGIHIWVVDDDADSRRLFCQLLGRQMAIETLQQFASAESALIWLKNKPAPEIILMDVQLPGMSGIEAIPKVHQVAPGTRVLVMTSFFDENNRRQAMAGGAANFLGKKSLRKIVEAIQCALVPPVLAAGSDATGAETKARL